MTDEEKNYLNEPFEVMEEEAKKSPEQKSQEKLEMAIKTGKISPGEEERWRYEASIQKGSQREFLYEYIGNRSNLREEYVNKLHEFFDNDEYVQEGIDATEPMATFKGVVNEILFRDEGFIAFTYVPEGKTLPLCVIRDIEASNFEKINTELGIGTDVEVKLNEKGEIDSVNLLSQGAGN